MAKKEVNLEQLLIDGIAQMKTERQLLLGSNGPFDKDGFPFIDTPALFFDTYFMREMLGRSVKVTEYTTYGSKVLIKVMNPVNPKKGAWYFPLSAVKY